MTRSVEARAAPPQDPAVELLPSGIERAISNLITVVQANARRAAASRVDYAPDEAAGARLVATDALRVEIHRLLAEGIAAPAGSVGR